MNLRKTLWAGIAALLWAVAGWAHAQAPKGAPYPAKPVRIVVGYAPGGATDIVGRLVAQKLQEATGQTFFVENRPGASATIACEMVARSAPDGYTLIIAATTSHSILPSLMKLTYDPQRDFAPVTQLVTSPLLLALHPSLPVRSVKELIALARARPGAITYASSGSGTSTHISAELFKAMTKTNLVHVPYKGGGPAVVDLIGGHVQTMFSTLPTVVQHVRTGRLRGLAVTGDSRFPATPEIPTVAESGVTGYEVSGWTGMFLPAGTPGGAVGRLAEETAKILNAPATRERFLVQGALPRARVLDEFAAFVDAEIVKWKKVVEFSGAKQE